MAVQFILGRVLVVTNLRGERVQILFPVDHGNNDRCFGNLSRIVQQSLRGDSNTLLVATVQRRLLALLRSLLLRLWTLEHAEETAPSLPLLIAGVLPVLDRLLPILDSSRGDQPAVERVHLGSEASRFVQELHRGQFNVGCGLLGRFHVRVRVVRDESRRRFRPLFAITHCSRFLVAAVERRFLRSFRLALLQFRPLEDPRQYTPALVLRLLRLVLLPLVRRRILHAVDALVSG